ncbi:MAG: hypothetical protein ACYTFK_12090 [Planctomycetota bacterium]
MGRCFATDGADFGLLVGAAIREVLAEFALTVAFGADLALAVAGLDELIGVVIRDVFAGLILLGAAGFGAFGACTTAGALERLRLGVLRPADPDAFGLTELRAPRLRLAGAGFDARGWLLRCCRGAAALGADTRGLLLFCGRETLGGALL